MKQLLFCVHDANGRGPAHCPRRGRRRRQRSPRCGPRRWPGMCSPATGRWGGRQAPGPEARAKAHDLAGARSAIASALKPSESRVLDNAICPKASSASNPRRCIASVAWLASWHQRTRPGPGCATVTPARRAPPPMVGAASPGRGPGHTISRARAFILYTLFILFIVIFSGNLVKGEGSDSHCRGYLAESCGFGSTNYRSHS